MICPVCRGDMIREGDNLVCVVCGEEKIIKRNDAQPKWIPVTERLPDERKWVLCQCRANIRMVLRLQNGYWHQDSEHEYMKSFVTHWMSLPEPPKGEEE